MPCGRLSLPLMRAGTVSSSITANITGNSSTSEALCPNSLYTHNHASPKFLKMRILKPAGQLEHLLSSHLSAGESANLSFNPSALRYSCGYYIYALLHILI